MLPLGRRQPEIKMSQAMLINEDVPQGSWTYTDFEQHHQMSVLPPYVVSASNPVVMGTRSRMSRSQAEEQD
jgi:hypothetical protein